MWGLAAAHVDCAAEEGSWLKVATEGKGWSVGYVGNETAPPLQLRSSIDGDTNPDSCLPRLTSIKCQVI